MAKSWNYAELSKVAAANGGPEALLENLAALYTKKGYSEGFKKGAKSKNPIIAAACVASSILGAGGLWVYNKLKQKRALAAEAAANEEDKIKEVEAELIVGMEAAANEKLAEPFEDDLEVTDQ